VESDPRALKTIVIGGAGFLGSHLVPLLLQAGDQVTVQDVISVEAAMKLKHVTKDVKYVWKSALDITKEDLGPYDRIVHLAAQGDAPLAASSPKWTFALNLDATLAVLEAARQRMAADDDSSFKIVFMSSDSVYGHIPAEKLPVTEDGPLHPSNTYGASKAAAEMAIYAYNAQWNLPVIVLRGTTMFGEGSRMAQVIPIFIRQAIRNEPITLEGDGSQTRDVNYVKNTANAILNALDSGFTHGTWNIGSGKEISVRELAGLIVKLAGSESEITNKPWRPGERGLRLFLSIEKAKKELSYSPMYSQEEALGRTIDWIKRLG